MARDESWREPLEARLPADRVIAGLGEWAHHDVMAGPDNRLIFLRDAEKPRLILPEAFVALDLNMAPL